MNLRLARVSIVALGLVLCGTAQATADDYPFAYSQRPLLLGPNSFQLAFGAGLGYSPTLTNQRVPLSGLGSFGVAWGFSDLVQVELPLGVALRIAHGPGGDAVARIELTDIGWIQKGPCCWGFAGRVDAREYITPATSIDLTVQYASVRAIPATAASTGSYFPLEYAGSALVASLITAGIPSVGLEVGLRWRP